jgi:glycosyltransferase involved in cell wall biosynthesis
MNLNLVISNGYPLPENSGAKIRTMNYVRVLKKIGRVELCYTSSFVQSQMNSNMFSKEYHLWKKEYPSSVIDRVHFAVWGLPYPINLFQGKVKDELIKKINQGSYNIILIRYLNNTGILKEFNDDQKKKVIIDIDDIITETLYRSMFNETNSVFKKFLRLANKYLLKRYQANIINNYQTVFCSDLDKIKYAGEMKTAHTIPNTYWNESITKYEFDQGYLNKNVLLFVGLLGYGPNVEGLKWFINTIYGDFVKKFENAKLLVVGSSPSDEIIKICGKYRSIELYANAESLIPYYNAARVVIVPVLRGGGTRIKILEAGLTNRPVLSTAMGAYGLNLKNGKDFLLFENKAEFMKGYMDLSNQKYYGQITRNLKEIVKTRFSQNSFETGFNKILESQ